MYIHISQFSANKQINKRVYMYAFMDTYIQYCYTVQNERFEMIYKTGKQRETGRVVGL